jgi:hypothetical protein
VFDADEMPQQKIGRGEQLSDILLLAKRKAKEMRQPGAFV